MPVDLLSVADADCRSLLCKKGAALGLSETDVISLISQFGPALADLLIKLLEWKRSLRATATPSSVINLAVIEQLLAQLLSQYKTQIEGWIDKGEGAIFDALLGLLAGKTPILAALLGRFKSTIIADLDPVVANAIDAVIAYLQGNTPPPPVPAPSVQ